MTTPTTKEEAAKTIDALIDLSRKVINDAMELADQFGLEFRYEPEYIGTYHGKGSDGDSSGDGEWYPSSWSSSSIYC